MSKEITCGRCGGELSPWGEYPRGSCSRCGFMTSPQQHIQERDRRVEEMTKAVYPAWMMLPREEQDKKMDPHMIAEQMVNALDARAQERTGGADNGTE